MHSRPSYTPEHRRAVLKGLRILARVAIRSYMKEQAARTQDGGRRRGGGLMLSIPSPYETDILSFHDVARYTLRYGIW